LNYQPAVKNYSGDHRNEAPSSSENKKPGREAGLFVFLPIDSAENAGCIDDTGCRKQPKGDQKKFHDLPPSTLHYSFGLSGRNPRFAVGLSREA